MIRTEETDYLVVGKTTQRQGRTLLRLEVLSGDDEGRRVYVPEFHADYDTDVQATLESLTEGDVVSAILVGEVGGTPSWKVVDAEYELSL